MQEEACEVQSEDNKALLDKNKKRTFKTPNQVQALEKLYNDNKYPSEELRAQFAASIGLTDKQVSGWLCHRRLKDKRDEVSASATIVHKQDSCGSTKEGAYRNFDHKEVQSRGFNTQNLLAADVAYEHDHRRDGKKSDLNDTSSDTSSPLQNRVRPRLGPADVAAFRARSGPSGYLKVKARPEDLAITSVKRRMGRQYQEDGPPLSVKFDQLPPGAFESSVNNPDNESQHVGIPDLQLSLKVVTSGDMYNVEMTQRNPHLGGSTFRAKPPSHGYGEYISHQFMPKPAFPNCSAPFLKHKSSTEREGLSSGIPVYREKSYKMMGKHGFRERTKDDFVNCGHRENFLYKSENVSTEQVRTQHFEAKYPNVLAKRSKSFDMETKRMFKDDKCVRERSAIKGSFNSATAQGGKRAWEEFLEQRYSRKPSSEERLLWTNRTKRMAAADMPSSFSEDETAETSSSGD